mmetsp:Transcript_7345/g.15120  ORF Transcript_7345/g.15120 Transcript_7345/m.15120 type:complete len:426 (+) Transcript_7345:1567-2844(+)
MQFPPDIAKVSLFQDLRKPLSLGGGEPRYPDVFRKLRRTVPAPAAKALGFVPEPLVDVVVVVSFFGVAFVLLCSLFSPFFPVRSVKVVSGNVQVTAPQEFAIETRVVSGANVVVVVVVASFLFRYRFQYLFPVPQELLHVSVPVPPAPKGFLLAAVVRHVGLNHVHSGKKEELEAPLRVVVVGAPLAPPQRDGSTGSPALFRFGSEKRRERGLLLLRRLGVLRPKPGFLRFLFLEAAVRARRPEAPEDQIDRRPERKGDEVRVVAPLRVLVRAAAGLLEAAPAHQRQGPGVFRVGERPKGDVAPKGLPECGPDGPVVPVVHGPAPLPAHRLEAGLLDADQVGGPGFPDELPELGAVVVGPGAEAVAVPRHDRAGVVTTTARSAFRGTAVGRLLALRGAGVGAGVVVVAADGIALGACHCEVLRRF